MPNDSVETIPLDTLPTELLYHIFFFLSPEELMKCRQICKKWKIIIDGLASKESLWSKFCKRDFNKYYWIAKKKASPDFSWYNLYRSLSLWPRLAYAEEDCDEFACASRFIDEIRSVDILGGGVAAVHKKDSIAFYDANTFTLTKRRPILGDYARYTENDNYIVIQTYQLQLYVIRKVLHSSNHDMKTATFENIKMYLLTDAELYLIKLTDEIYVCNLTQEPLACKFIKRAEDLDGVMSIGYKDGCLNILTYQRNIYSIVNNKDMVLQQSLDSEPNILNALYKYNLLEQLDWRVYFQWMYVLRHTMPQGPMREIIVIKPYGNIFLVGTTYGVLSIFYEPFVNGELNLFDTKPLRQINFMERSDIPVLASCPILNMDVLETENGHKVFVAMPKKISVLKFTHSFIRPPMWAILPYSEVHRAQFLNEENDKK